jgi:peptide/nickel transport system ATP-binding protein
MNSDPLLEIRNLTTEFSSEGKITTAVNNVSFILNKGETLGIVGESGSGKSVTSLSIMRLIASPPGKISGGEIIFKNGSETNLLSLKEKEIRKYRGKEIAMIFQEPMTSLNPVMRCGKQVAEAIKLHLKFSSKKAKEKTLQLFEEVQLPRPEDIYNSYPHELSGGQKQRVMIAMAMSCDPSILIADEPTTALDVTVQKTILELMKKLQQKHQMSIVFITHDLGVIAEIADRILVMYKGKIVESGSVKEIFSNPQHPYTKGLLACRPDMDRRLKKLPVVSDFMDESDDGTISEKKISIEELTGTFVVTTEERVSKHQQLYSESPLLEVKDLKTYFPIRKGIFGRRKNFVKAVDDVSFNVYPGETLGLVGESGCGKTTLGRTILRLIEPTDGQVLFKGADIAKLSLKEMRGVRKNLQIIFQDPYSSLNPRITIGSAIMEPMQVHKIYDNNKQRKEKVMELLRKVNLSENHFNRYPHEFSGGQRQRICIARALALNPEFIICDESVSALDVSIQAQVLNLLNDLKREFGFTYIFISHDLSVVKFMSDRMIVMKDGKIQEYGDADEIYSNPKTEYTKKLIDAIPKGEFKN